MEKNIKKYSASTNKKEIYKFRFFIFFLMLVVVLIRAFARGSVATYPERLSWFLNFNYNTDGSFVSLLNSNIMKPVGVIFYTAFLFFTATALEKFYHALPDSKKTGKILLTVIPAVSPVLFMYYCKPTVYDRAGVIVFTIVLLRLLFLQKSFLNVLIPVLTAVCVLVHHNSFFTVYPSVFIISIMLLSGEKKEKIILAIDATVAVVTLFISSSFNFYGKDQSFFLKMIILIFVSLPILKFIVQTFLKSKNKKYSCFLFIPVLFSMFALFTTNYIGAVFSQTVTSLILIIIFGVIYKEKHITMRVISAVDFCNKKPVLLIAVIAFQAALLRVEPTYFGFIGEKIANYFCL